MCNCCLVVLDCWLHQEEHFRVDFERLQVLDVSFDFEYQSTEADVLRYGLAVVQLVSKDLAVHDILKLVKQRILAFDDRVVVVRLVVHAYRSRNAYFVELSFRHRVNIWVYVERNLELVDFCFAFDSGNYTTALRCLHCKDQHTRAHSSRPRQRDVLSRRVVKRCCKKWQQTKSNTRYLLLSKYLPSLGLLGTEIKWS